MYVKTIYVEFYGLNHFVFSISCTSVYLELKSKIMPSWSLWIGLMITY